MCAFPPQEQLDMFEDQSTEVEETYPWCFHSGEKCVPPECGESPVSEQFDRLLDENARMDSPRSEQFERQVKEKENKPPLQYIPYGPLEEVARVFGYGAKKYRPNLWRDEPTNVTARLGSAMRHIFLVNENWEDFDVESGHHHLAHAIVQLMFAYEYLQHPEQKYDDRRRSDG